MKKTLLILLAFILILSLTGCSPKTVKQDESPITMYIGLGNNQAYYDELLQSIKEHLGIDVQMVYSSAIDTTSATRLEFKYNDLPADIVITASLTNPEWAANSCLDLVSYTQLSDVFTYQKINEYKNDDGTIYQLPFTSKLIGITYNKTLMEENGWDVPENFNDMLELKKECDEKGILFAVSANAATGHGFNYLFHTMGADWLNTLEGSNWFWNFIDGKEDISAFKEQAVYFNQWVENGLFGSIHSQDWASSAEYCGKRALFFFDLTNTVYSYDGEMLDENGDSTGVTLHDEYASMPWISEDGSTNCFTYYDNMFLAVNKKLAEKDQKDRLEKVVKILEFMTTEDATKIFTDVYPDGYIALNTFQIDESRDYFKYKDSIESGFIMPWYYTYFDDSTIVNTGESINTYLRGEGSSYEEIMETLATNNNNNLSKNKDILTSFTDDLSYEDTARLNAVGAIVSLQNEYDANGIEETVSAGLIAYVNQLEDYQPFTTLGAVSTRAYAGEFERVYLNTIVSAKSQKVMGVKMTGRQLKEIANEGLKDNDAVYPYVLLSSTDIQDDQTYVVAVSQASLNDTYLNDFTDNGSIISLDSEIVEAPINAGIEQFLEGKDTVSAKDFVLAE